MKDKKTLRAYYLIIINLVGATENKHLLIYRLSRLNDPKDQKLSYLRANRLIFLESSN